MEGEHGQQRLCLPDVHVRRLGTILSIGQLCFTSTQEPSGLSITEAAHCCFFLFPITVLIWGPLRSIL